MIGAGTTAPADMGTLTLAALPASNPLSFDDFSGHGYIEAPEPEFYDEDGIPNFGIGTLPAKFYTRITPERGGRLCGWEVWQMRRDQHGREWRCSWNAVVDDFGTLVEVTQ